MIRIIVLTILLTGCTDISSDKVLHDLRSQLPKQWSYSIGDQTLTLRCDEPVWIIYENKLNAPIDITARERDQEYFIQNGKQIYPELALKVISKKDMPGVKQKIEDNALIRKEISDLPRTMNIEHLIDRHLSSKGTLFFEPVTDSDKVKVAAYFDKVKELESKISQVPDYETEFYYLFLQETSVLSDDFTTAYPDQIVREFNMVKSLLEKNRCR